MNLDILLGKSTEHLVPLEGTKFFVHHEMLSNFLKLQVAAKDAGFNLQIISAFRDYQRQLNIWNTKVRRERSLMDKLGSPLFHQVLTPHEIIFSILRWSALPGASRHHWGTDIDIFDGNTQTPEEVTLTPDECENNGPAARLHDWLDEMIETNQSFGFFRPYNSERGGISPERWHLSYWPLSSSFFEKYEYTLLKKSIESSDIELKETVLDNLDMIFKKYITNIDFPSF